MLVNSQLVSLEASSTRVALLLTGPRTSGNPRRLPSGKLLCSLRVKRRYGWRIREKGTISGFSTSPLVF